MVPANWAGLAMKLYGLKTCDTCRRARKALEAAGNTVEFIDLRENPLTEDEVARFVDLLGEGLLNRRSTTWRGLSEPERQEDPRALILRHPPLMKRPVIVSGTSGTSGTHVTMGWDKPVQLLHLGDPGATD